MSYIITDSALPVMSCASALYVYSNGADKSVVIWEGSFLPKAPVDEKKHQTLLVVFMTAI